MESVENKKRNQDSKRLTLTDKILEKTKLWLSQIEQEFNGMLSLKRNDLLNAILEELDEQLSEKLLLKIRKDKLTTKKIAEWILIKSLEAEKEGQEANLSELIKAAQGGSKSKRKTCNTSINKPKTPTSESAKISQKTVEKPSNST